MLVDAVSVAEEASVKEGREKSGPGQSIDIPSGTTGPGPMKYGRMNAAMFSVSIDVGLVSGVGVEGS